jgi:hypothetical protein
MEWGKGVRLKINFFVNLLLLPLWSERGGEEVKKYTAIQYTIKKTRIAYGKR